MAANTVTIEHVCTQIKKHTAIFWTMQSANGEYLDRQDDHITIDASAAQFMASANAIKGDYFKVRISPKPFTDQKGGALTANSFVYMVICRERILPDYQYLQNNQAQQTSAENNRLLDLQIQLIEERHKRALEDMQRNFEERSKKDPAKEKRAALIERLLEHLFMNEMSKPGAVQIATHPAPIAGAPVNELAERLKIALQELKRATGGQAELIDTLEKLVNIAKDNPAAFNTYVKMIRGI